MSRHSSATRLNSRLASMSVHRAAASSASFALWRHSSAVVLTCKGTVRNYKRLPHGHNEENYRDRTEFASSNTPERSQNTATEFLESAILLPSPRKACFP
jgi:hypothetical protein